MSETQVVDLQNLYFYLAPFLLPLLILIFIVTYFKTSSSSSRSLKIPPGPYPWPLLGNLFHMGKNMPHITLSNFSKTYGPLISLKLGTQLIIIASSPLAATEILKTQDHVLSGRSIPKAIPIKETEINNISMGLALECGERWRYFRTIFRTHLFSGKALQAQESIRERKVMEMVKYVGRKEGMVVDIGEIVFNCIYNMLTNVLLSKDIFNLKEDVDDDDGEINGGIKGDIRTAMETYATPNISDFYPILCGLDLQGLRKESKEWSEKMNATWASTIKERRERDHGTTADLTRDFLDVLTENNLTNDCINQLGISLSFSPEINSRAEG